MGKADPIIADRETISLLGGGGAEALDTVTLVYNPSGTGVVTSKEMPFDCFVRSVRNLAGSAIVSRDGRASIPQNQFLGLDGNLIAYINPPTGEDQLSDLNHRMKSGEKLFFYNSSSTTFIVVLAKPRV